LRALAELCCQKQPEGVYFRAGGSRDERLEAREWSSFFMQEVLVRDN
jgi:hypothetical protein